MTAEVGVIHGRFQPLHNGHMEYLLEGKKRCGFLWVGIANPDPSLVADDPINPHRSLPTSNPFTYFERMMMIRESLLGAGIPGGQMGVVPFPINHPHLLRYYVPLDARFFVTIYDNWNRKKVEILRSLGANVEIMWERSMSDRVTSGVEIRSLIALEGEWKHLVPPASARVIYEIGIETVISRMNTA